MINKITIEKVASYKKKVSLLTDKRINLIYGLNRTGKSTLSNFFYFPINVIIKIDRNKKISTIKYLLL